MARQSARGGGMVTGQIDTCINNGVSYSREPAATMHDILK